MQKDQQSHAIIGAQWKCSGNSASDFLKQFTSALSLWSSKIEKFHFMLRCRCPFDIKASCLRAVTEPTLFATTIF
jgi:hypothetical protein